MPRYIDCFITPIPKRNLAKYRKIATVSAKVWKDHGALEYVESVGDDVPAGKSTSFAKSVKLKRGEVVMVSWAVYKSKKDRDRIMARIMKDKRLEAFMDPKKMPFDGKRMFFGGFKEFIRR